VLSLLDTEQCLAQNRSVPLLVIEHTLERSGWMINPMNLGEYPRKVSLTLVTNWRDDLLRIEQWRACSKSISAALARNQAASWLKFKQRRGLKSSSSAFAPNKGDCTALAQN